MVQPPTLTKVWLFWQFDVNFLLFEHIMTQGSHLFEPGSVCKKHPCFNKHVRTSHKTGQLSSVFYSFQKHKRQRD